MDRKILVFAIVQGSEFRAQGSGFRAQGAGFRMRGSGSGQHENVAWNRRISGGGLIESIGLDEHPPRSIERAKPCVWDVHGSSDQEDTGSLGEAPNAKRTYRSEQSQLGASFLTASGGRSDSPAPWAG